MSASWTRKDFLILGVTVSTSSHNYWNHLSRTLRWHQVPYPWILRQLEGWAWFLLLYLPTTPDIGSKKENVCRKKKYINSERSEVTPSRASHFPEHASEISGFSLPVFMAASLPPLFFVPQFITLSLYWLICLVSNPKEILLTLFMLLLWFNCLEIQGEDINVSVVGSIHVPLQKVCVDKDR